MIELIVEDGPEGSCDGPTVMSTNKAVDWKPEVTFEKGIELTIDWYLENSKWWYE